MCCTNISSAPQITKAGTTSANHVKARGLRPESVDGGKSNRNMAKRTTKIAAVGFARMAIAAGRV
jgi:hypothetical protein